MAILEINQKDFENEVLNSNKTTVVDFYANWCGPCRMLKPVLEEVSNEKQNFKFVAVNVDEAENLSARYGVQSIPCVVIFKNGKEVKRSLGFRPKEDIEDILGEI